VYTVKCGEPSMLGYLLLRKENKGKEKKKKRKEKK
jgi:hypothetical protein